MDIVSIVLAAPLTGNPTSGFVGDAFTFWSMDRIEGWFWILFIGVVLGRGGRADWVTNVEGQGRNPGPARTSAPYADVEYRVGRE